MTLASPTWTTRFLPLAALLGTALAARAPTFGRRSRNRPPRTLAHHVGTFTVLSVAGMVLAFQPVTGVERPECQAVTCKVARGADEWRHGPAPLRPVGFDDIWSQGESEDAGHRPSGWIVQRIGRLDREPLRLGATDAGVPHRPAGPSAAGAPPAMVRESPA